jgi:outer membrane protein assembly factor BamD (BamD/ComL family)
MRNFIYITSFVFVVASCNSPKEEPAKETVVPKDTVKTITVDTLATKDCSVLYKRARTTDSTLQKALEVDPALANKAIRAFTDYAFYCESDSSSPVFLIKTAQVAMAINNPNQAKVVLDRCISNYPKFRNKPAAIFMLAELYDEQTLLNDETEAKKLYEKLIEEYPKSEWAASAKGAIKLLGKTDEQIVNEFNKKKK